MITEEKKLSKKSCSLVEEVLLEEEPIKLSEEEVNQQIREKWFENELYLS